MFNSKDVPLRAEIGIQKLCREESESGEASTRGGASSKTTCTFVPIIPNELTPARRTPQDGSHEVSSLLMKMADLAKSINGLRFAQCRLGKRTRCFRDKTALTRPTIPAALQVCPMLLLTEDNAQKCLCEVTWPNA